MSKQKKRITKHHIVNRCKGGTDTKRNIILLAEEKHHCWHILFGNRTFREAAALLIRAAEMKEAQNDNL